MRAIPLLLLPLLLLSALPLVPGAAADDTCETYRELTGRPTCFPVWYVECAERSAPKNVARCFEGGDPH